MSMVIELEERDIAPATIKYGSDTFQMGAGKRLTIETSPQGVDILREDVPEGKAWTVNVRVEIIETDAEG